jgi:hypothetical protein
LEFTMPQPSNGLFTQNAVARELVRLALAMTTAAGTVYTSVRSALSDHESRIGLLESRQNAADQREVPRQEIEAHWSAISTQLSRLDQDIREMRAEQALAREPALRDLPAATGQP